MTSHHPPVTCPTCNTVYTPQLNGRSLLACARCATILQSRDMEATPPRPMPDDWSFVQIGTTGVYKDKPFTIIGRIRLQLRNDYKNCWSAVYGNGQCLWIIESFASFSVFDNPWVEYTGDHTKLRAGSKVSGLFDQVSLDGEYVEKCEGLSYAGEVGPWPFFTPGFFVVQASENTSTALFLIKGSEVVHNTGRKVLTEKLGLKQTITWHEWQ
jgi:hypothetical protein